jgi:predicted Zn-dependent protease
MFRTEASAEPVRYYYSPKETTLVDSEGATVDWKYLRADMPVRYTYVKEGDRMIVRKITLQKPLSYYEKTTTTTTTTKP